MHIKSASKTVKALASLLLATLAMSAIASTQFIVNGGFEQLPLGSNNTSTVFPGWTATGASPGVTVTTNAIGGTYSAESHFASVADLAQFFPNIGSWQSSWVLDLDFACSQPTNSADRTFALCVHHTPAITDNKCINIKVIGGSTSGLGNLMIYNGSSFQTIFANGVSFSTSDTNTLQVNHITIVGHYNVATPNYDVTLVNASGVTNTSSGLALYQTSAPTNGSQVLIVRTSEANLESGSWNIIDNASFTVDSINFTPITITTQPVSLTVLAGAPQATFSAQVGGLNYSSQWLFNNAPIAGATNTTLILSNITTAMAGNYSLYVSNYSGTATSSNAVLTVNPVNNTPQMTNIWTLLPDSRIYLSSSNSTERSLAYNPTDKTVLLSSRTNIYGRIVVLDALTGAEKWYLNVDSSVVTPSVSGAATTLALNMIGVGDDGYVYGANLTTSNSYGYYYQIYIWQGDSSNTPVYQLYSGDPGVGVAPGLRWGDNLAVRGAWPNVQILTAPATGTNVAILSSSDNSSLNNSQIIKVSGVPSGFAQLGIAYGPGTNTFWAKSVPTNDVVGTLYLVQFDLGAGTGTVIHTYTNISSTLRGIAVDQNQKWLAGISMEIPNNVLLYNISNLVSGPIQSDQELFTTFNPNTSVNNGVGSAAIGDNYVFALDCNNGINAFLIDTNYTGALLPFKILSIGPSGNQLSIGWESVAGHGYQVQSSSSLTGVSWSNVGSSVSATGAVTSTLISLPGAGAQFYRVQGQ